MTPTNLRCEYLFNPLGLDEPRPRLSWTLTSDRRGARQAAYQVRVAAAAARLAQGDADIWDSGRVASSQSAHIVYQGPALRSGQRVWWQVRVWDDSGGVADSEVAWWEMGLLAEGDWTGQCISLDQDYSDALMPSPYLCRPFTIDRPIRQARLYVTARGLYEVRLNGQRVGDALFTPGWTDYRIRLPYQTYDVTDLLREGENALGAILGTGWYAGNLGYKDDSKVYGPYPELLLELRLTLADGTTQVITTDDQWRATTGPIRYSDMLMGETNDARLDLGAWDQPGYDDAAWSPVRVKPRDEVKLVADRAEPVRITQELHPKVITVLPSDLKFDGGEITNPAGAIEPGGAKGATYMVDMGQNMVGWVRLRVQGAAGTQVQMRFAEMLNPDGTLYTESLRRARQTDVYILRGEGEEVFEPRFTFHGFRYVEVTGYPGELTSADLMGCVIHSDTPRVGDFTCSHPMVNQLQRNIVWGQRGNFLSVPTDCPQRDERLGWLGDAQVFIRTAAYNMDVAAFFTKWMQDVEDAQSPEGGFSNVAPRVVTLADGAPAWGDAGIIVPWTVYQMYGDTRILERHWDAMTRWMRYLREANPNLLWLNRRGNDFGDWLAHNAETPKDLIATAYWAYDASLMARMAQALGRDDEADEYTRLFEGIRAAFNQAYVTEEGRVQGETQTGYVLALMFDLLPAALRPLAARRLVDDIAARGWHLSTGFVGVSYLLPVLTQVGYVDVAYRLLLNDTFPSWGYSIRHGATTIWERWDGWTAEKGFQTPKMNSFNHYAYGSVGQWLYQVAAGIDVDPTRPGFERIIIRPRIGDGLTEAGASYHSIRGPIRSGWQVDADGRLTLSVTIPANTTATVYIPASDAAQVREGGHPLAAASGVRVVGVEEGAVVCEVGGGEYTFQVGK